MMKRISLIVLSVLLFLQCGRAPSDYFDAARNAVGTRHVYVLNPSKSEDPSYIAVDNGGDVYYLEISCDEWNHSPAVYVYRKQFLFNVSAVVAAQAAPAPSIDSIVKKAVDSLYTKISEAQDGQKSAVGN